MTRLNPYIGFNGACREAMGSYQAIFGGELSFMTVGETPVKDQMPPGSDDKIMHAFLDMGEFFIMGTDMGSPEATGLSNRISVAIECSSEEELNRIFKSLAEGGNVFCPVGPAFWGGMFGGTIDRFGVSWVLTFNSGQ